MASLSTVVIFSCRCCCQTHRSDVGQCESAPHQVGSPQLTRCSEHLEAVQLKGDLEHAEQLDVLHIGNQQTLTCVHCQADVVGRLNHRKHHRQH